MLSHMDSLHSLGPRYFMWHICLWSTTGCQWHIYFVRRNILRERLGLFPQKTMVLVEASK